jgi:hypothetical protein
MTGAPKFEWHAANQRYLIARLAVIRAALTRHAARANGAADGEAAADETATNADAMLDEATRALLAPAALDTLCAAFSLSPFERDVLLMCAGVELDSTFAPTCAAAHANPQRPFPTFSLALAALPDAHWTALSPAGPLRRWRLIDVGAADSLTTGQLRIDERVLHYLTGVTYVDARLYGLIEPLPRPPMLPPSQREVADRITALWSQSKDNAEGWPIILLGGDDRAAARAVAGHAADALGMQVHVLHAADIPMAPAERDALARLWEREAVLSHSVLLIDGEGDAERQRAAHTFIESVFGMLLIASREPFRHSWDREVVRLEVNKPSAVEQQRLWQHALGPAAAGLNGELDVLTSQFSFGLDGIRAASAQALERGLQEDDALGPVLWDACRISARSRVDDLAQRIEPMAGWPDLVLPDAQLCLLREISTHVHQRSKVYDTWGFASKGARGLGISALFAGASGTGKTMAAEVLANDLRLDLYRIDLSQVVSKYIGETEKNLRRVFDAAEDGGAVLLFDEADALFGKRSEVRDSHDRYANIEISYLLQRMEAYRGLAILTTNLKSVLDPAFLRRIRFVVSFPFPDAGQRAQIWRRIFPERTPTENLDVDKLARLNVAGGNIRNIALQAAFLAADADEPVRMAHLLRAARSEYAKLEKPLTDAESGGWM